MAFSGFVLFGLFLLFTPGFSTLCEQKKIGTYYYTYCREGCCQFNTYSDPCCHETRDVNVAIIASVCALVVIIVIMICVVWQVRKRRHQPGVTIQPGQVVPPSMVTTTATHGVHAYSGPYSSGNFQTSYPTATTYPTTTYPATSYPLPPPYSLHNIHNPNGNEPGENKY